MSNQHSFTDEMIRDYLLGKLDDDLQLMIECQIITDDTFLEVIEALEDDLIDDYVDGMLNNVEKGLFEFKYLKSAKKLSEIRLTKQLKIIAASDNKKDINQ
ncbi:MAG TPA: hypothetical protein PKY82_02595 [Pyrinomonadaceae bacterium]|nr:hypothetical protein [Pyrinomonadaceae bacterium]